MRTITKLADPQPHGAISECASGEFAVVGFDVHQNVIDANITFHGKYVGDTVKFGDTYYIIREARVVAIKDEWWWILDVEEDSHGATKLQFDKAWQFLGQHVKTCIGYHEPNVFDYPATILHDAIKDLSSYLTKVGIDSVTLEHIALAITILYSRESEALPINPCDPPTLEAMAKPKISPNIEPASERSPITILQEQADLLSVKTKGLVVGKVIQYKNNINQLYYGFNLTAPLLSGYTCNLFDIIHKIPYYPVRFILQGDIAQELYNPLEGKDYKDSELITEVDNEHNFANYLRIILRASTTVNVVKSLVAQSQNSIKDKH